MNDAGKSRDRLLADLVELRQRHELLSRLIEASPDSIVLTRLSDGKILEANEGFSRNSGIPRQDAIGRTTTALNIWVNTEDRDRFAKILEEKGECRNFATTLRGKGGRIVHSLISAHVTEVDGERCLVANSRNVHDLKEAEEALARQADDLRKANELLTTREQELEERNEQLQREVSERVRSERVLKESEAQFRMVVEILGEGLLITDVHDVVLDLNKRVTEMTGFPASELIGKPATETLLDAGDRPKMQARNERRFSGEPEAYEIRIRRRDGSWFWGAVNAAPYHNAAGEVVGTLGAVSDITERKRLESEMVRLERMSALGAMAQGVAHNFNNILTVVLGYAELVQARVTESPLREEVKELVDAATRAADLVKRLNQAVRTDEDVLVPVSVQTVAREVVVATTPKWKDEPESRGIPITIDTDFVETPPIWGTESGLHSVFLNLLFNALDALPDGGAIRIGSKLDSDHVEVTFSDDGVGMSEETRRRVFEPFFTTKMTVGTGLGLASVYGIVTRWGGECVVDSTLGRGTTMRIRLRIADPAHDSPAVEEPPAAIGREGSIVVVEDEESICAVLTRILSPTHRVDSYHNGADALERFAPGLYDVALIDLSMPGMPGDQVARKLKEADPCLATVLITGWALEEEDERLANFDFHLGKPIQARTLRDTVARALELHDSRWPE